MPTEAVDVGMSDQELFNEANADETPADEAVVEAPEAEVEQVEQPRDEHGRFAEKSQTEQLTEAAAEVKTEAEKPAVDDNAAMVPSWRVREINEEKRALADRLAAIEAERSKWQQPPQAPPAQQAQVEEPDPLLDPKAYREFIREETRKEILNERREASLANAHKTYKAEFEEAYAAAQKQVDPVLRIKMQNSRDPGETLIEWHREQKTRAEVGNDPNAFFERRMEAYLKDPANQAKLLEKIRGTATQQPGATRQAPNTQLPPSLTRATNAAATTTADDEDISNDGLWRHANA